VIARTAINLQIGSERLESRAGAASRRGVFRVLFKGEEGIRNAGEQGDNLPAGRRFEFRRADVPISHLVGPDASKFPRKSSRWIASSQRSSQWRMAKTIHHG